MNNIFKQLIKLLIIIETIVLVLIPLQKVSAHPADMYFQTFYIEFDEETIHIDWSISPGPLLAPSIWYDADANHDNTIDDDEAKTWLNPHIMQLSASYGSASLSDWDIVNIDWPLSLPAFEIGDETIEIELSTSFPSHLPGEKIQIYNQFNETITVNWFYLSSMNEVSFYVPRQEGGLLEWEPAINDRDDADDDERHLYTYWDSGIPSLSPDEVPTESMESIENQQPEDNRAVTRLTNMLREENISFTFFISAIFVAILLGALHALTPGHGKAIVAAYLIGSKGTLKHAVFLGSIVTVTHTGSVFLLGVITMLASQYIVPTDLFPYLEILSGVMISILGLSLLIQRWNIWKENILHPPTYAIYKPKQKDPEVSVKEKQPQHDRIKINQPIKEQGPEHKHPDIPEPDKVTLRSIIALGISGGIVPCPDAVSILLIAVLINRIFLGLSLIVAFSLGLAVVLIAIGMFMVRSQRFFLKFDRANRYSPILSMFSALVVFSLGAILTINSINYYGLLQNGFNITSLINKNASDSQIVYLVLDDNNNNQLYTYDISDDQPEIAISDEEYGVWDYSVSPDGKWVVYTVPREEGGNDIHLLSSDLETNSVILECPGATCTNTSWSPDGNKIIFERLSFSAQSAVIGVPSLWWLDIESGESHSVFQDGDLPGYSPEWSPDGKWLCYATPGNNLVQFYNLATGDSFNLPSQSGGLADWSPDGKSVLVTDIRNQNEGYVIHLFSYSLEEETLLDLTDGTNAQDSIAAWSPSGDQLAVVRRTFQSTEPLTGDNLWLISPDGTIIKQLTHEEAAYHSPPVWSSDGKYILFHRYLILEKSLKSGIWMIDVNSGNETQLTEAGTRPSWLQ